MKIKSKIISYSSIVITSFFAITLLSNCENSGKKGGFSVVYHAGNGYKINGQQNFTATHVTTINAEPAPDPSEGRKFTGWYTTKDFTSEKCVFPMVVTADIDLYANWINDYQNAYTVKFNANGGSPVSNNIVKEGDNVEVCPYTSKEGYNFKGWYLSLQDDNPISFPFKVTANIELFAKWEKVAFQPIFRTTGSQPIGTEVIEENASYRLKEPVNRLLTAPLTKKDHCNFIGWYESEDATEPITFPYDLDETKCNLFAKFETQGFTVTLSDNEGGGEAATEIIENCTKIPYAPAAIKSAPKGRQFVGWKNGETFISNYPYKIEADTTLTAVYQNKTEITVSFKNVDGTTVQDSKNYYIGEVINDPDIPTKNYFDFNGWYEDSTLKTPINFPYVVSGENDRTFYASFTRNAFDVQIMNCENEDEVIYNKANVKDIVLPNDVYPPGREGDYKKEKYTFTNEATAEAVSSLNLQNIVGHLNGNVVTLYARWNTDSRRYRVYLNYGDGRTTEYFYPTEPFQVKSINKPIDSDKKVTGWKDKDGNPINEEQFFNPSEITFYAVWENLYRDLKVTRFDNPTRQDLPRDETFTHVKIDAKLSDIPHHDDSYRRYKLVGYYKSTDGETFEENYVPFKSGDTDNTIDNTWKAAKEAWVLVAGDLNVDYGDGTTGFITQVPLSFVPSEYIKKIRDDYEISGYTYKGVTYAPTQTIEITEGLSNITVNWTQTKFDVTYNYNYEGCQEPYILSHCTQFDDTIKPPTRGESIGFTGWFKEPACVNEFSRHETITKNTTAYAGWSDEGYTVKFNVGSGQLKAKFSDGSRIKTISTFGTFTDFPLPECEGNLFDGWYTKEVGGDKVTEVTGATELYAHWAPAGGYVTLCLKAESEGYFEETNTSDILVAVKENSYFYQFVNDLPNPKYPGDEFKIKHWSLTSNGEEIDRYSKQFTESAFLYAVDQDNPQTPTGSFANDSWATIIAVAENQYLGKWYDNGYEALMDWYPGLKVGMSKPMTINGRVHNARIIGFNQDFGSEVTNKTGKKLPVTFDFEDSVFVSLFGNDKSNMKQANWSTCYLRSRLQKGGDFYNLMPLYLTKHDHFANVYKYTKEATSTTKYKTAYSVDKMFIPNGYEINAYTTKLLNNDTYSDFVYTLYKGQNSNNMSNIIRKKYLDLGYCCYHTRGDIDYVSSQWKSYYVRIIVENGNLVWSYRTNIASVAAGRGICPFFCLGEAY